MINEAMKALERLGQRSTAEVIAEEIGCHWHEVPAVLMMMMAERGDTFRFDGLYFDVLKP